MLTAAQCRAARALIEWSREDLAKASKVAHRTVVDFERGARDPREITKDALRRALEAKGVRFGADGDEVCVRLERPGAPAPDLGAADGQ